ncbi:hypothetical protein A3H80_04015 [Candidatus Roizmanbacteria bacterium RIFCSPLOWO2_02_FULL_37_19]|uniref:Glycosyltransferase RgtA/B/C/D-like domain-containing protein n=1 Tax=Candidatus Roizmanbacteria bacterium RIFCSPHIGHO2_02_FULL_37_24 TaxID=1802037 RepID=A0A1F7GXC1_9BACT|nr:MAG: hypothetical protein A2862_04450 [Candidatus Roizmanbacteria bacterium RIFCSPHIGHO2_01_FULL_38_41]OGK23186.1 MAG: hypothetical protein A3C24_00825 [Candidatus Roizmanbacteria bacterium RIFCSPHIGHO2_02_FULL_37_24]OGK33830.1 MAG: hypothetical protein A3E10_05425 [Candidatus Roizmanbacteria bacterium RIFCSPHIGHO2_12_FULL_37_23]OGK43891.1 MAG: hypothetical protein A2956_01810 [Candidatus Roizmanbacteria bacterium RIFCSPLOWO2_01_FULL_37_57]OGK53674.1 MAG: hypothetical protein A3H80_04015 [Ca
MSSIKNTLQKIKKYHKFTAIILIFIVVFDFGYLLETGIWVNYYHHNFMIGTINDLLQGKHLLIDTFNQYGLFYPFILFLVFRTVLQFSYMNLYLAFMIGTVMYFAILYFFILLITKKNLLSLVGLLVSMGVVMTFNFPTFPFSENYVWPGSIPLRYFFDALVFLLVLKNRNFASRKLHFLTSGVVAFAVFYNLETGISLSIAYMFLLFTYVITKPLPLIKKVRYCLELSLPFLISAISIALFFSIYTYAQTSLMPDWALFWRFPLLYGAGLSNANTPVVGWHLYHLTVYFSVVTLYIFRTLFLKQSINWKWRVLTAYAFYGLFLLNYYMSRSYNSNLTLVSIPVIVLTIAFAGEKFTNAKKEVTFTRLISIVIIVSLTIGSIYFTMGRLKRRVYGLETYKTTKKYPGNRGFIMVSYSEQEDFTANDLLKSVAEIKKLTPHQKKILLFSRFDVLILVMSEKTHIISYPMHEQIYTLSELESMKKYLLHLPEKPEYIFIDTKNPLSTPPTSYNNAKELFETVKPYYSFYKKVGILDVYRLKQ